MITPPPTVATPELLVVQVADDVTFLDVLPSFGWYIAVFAMTSPRLSVLLVHPRDSVGAPFTSTDVVAVSPLYDAVMVVEPSPTPVIYPFSTVAVLMFPVDQTASFVTSVSD